MIASRLPESRLLPTIALLSGAIVWGLIWYPYRVIEAAGMGGVTATSITYGLALLFGLVPMWPVVRRLRPSLWLLLLGLSAAGTNLGYVLGTLDGVVMRVLLLFYLSPLWTVLLSRALLGERLILLFELVVAALASWLLAGEQMGLREWIGGTLIVVASLFSGHMGDSKARPRPEVAKIRS
jgi:drug/metabolite transporter (DMT)-like permease